MSKRSVVFSVLLILVMVLAACSGSGQDTTATEDISIIPGTTTANENTDLGALDTPMLTETAMPLDETAPAVTETTGGLATEGASTEGVATDSAATQATDLGTGTPIAGNETPLATPAGTGLAGTPGADGTPMATAAVTEPAATETVTGGESLRGATIEPEDARQVMILLSNWQGFSLADQSGQVFGSIDDYIINLCEAHILYMVVSTSDGSEILVPYEAVSVNGGTIDAESSVMTVNVDANALSGAPTLEQRPVLSAADWENEVRGYWDGVVSLSSLHSGCNVAATATQVAPDGSNQEGTTVTKLVYASSLSGATLQDGNGNVLGQVRDAVVEPESGQLFYLGVALDGFTGQEVVLVPIGAVNLLDDSAGQEGPATLMLLVENSVLENAPTLANISDLTTNVDPAAHDYWSQYVQMGPGPVNTDSP